jgi:hypothetical protein
LPANCRSADICYRNAGHDFLSSLNLVFRKDRLGPLERLVERRFRRHAIFHQTSIVVAAALATWGRGSAAAAPRAREARSTERRVRMAIFVSYPAGAAKP